MSDTIMVGFEIREDDKNMDEMQVLTTTVNCRVARLADELHMDILSVSHSMFNFDAKERIDVEMWRVYVTVIYRSNGQTASSIVEHVKRTWGRHWSAHSFYSNFVEIKTSDVRGVSKDG